MVTAMATAQPMTMVRAASKRISLSHTNEAPFHSRDRRLISFG